MLTPDKTIQITCLPCAKHRPLLDTYKSLLEDIGKMLVDLGLPLSLGDWGDEMGAGKEGGGLTFYFRVSILRVFWRLVTATSMKTKFPAFCRLCDYTLLSQRTKLAVGFHTVVIVIKVA